MDRTPSKNIMHAVQHHSEYSLVNMAGHSHVGVISITEPTRTVDRLEDDKWATVLRLYFHDIDSPYEGYTLFSEEQANQILDWLDAHVEELSGIYVHCAAGASRSAAVAKFIADKYGLFFDELRGSLYNRHVYKTLRHCEEKRQQHQAA